MVVCLVSRHTHDDTTKRRPRNGTVGPEIAIFTTKYNFGHWIQIPTQKFITANTTYAWSAIAFFLTSWFSGKTDSFEAVVFMGRSEDGTEPGCGVSRRVKSTASRYSDPSFFLLASLGLPSPYY